jgi:predicted nucleotidyltransferase
MTIAELINVKREGILGIAGRYGARDIRIFGSVARGEEREDSDIDLLVRLDPGVGFLRHAALIRELESLLGRKVDVVSERGLRPRIRERVLQEAVRI